MASGGGATWSKEETLKLIEVWGQETIQEQLQACKRNQSIFEAVAREMREAGYDRTYQQCREKIKKLKGEYRKAKDKQGKTGEQPSTWEFFDSIDAILGTKPSTRPPITIDSSETIESIEKTQIEEEGETKAEPLSLDSSTHSAGSSSGTTEAKPTISRKRKKPKSEPVFVDLMERVISAQSKSDEKMLELEEKRMKMEERQLEREDQQRKEDRQFQIQMMRIMMGSAAYNFPPPSNHPSLGQRSSSSQSAPSSPFAFGSPSMYDYSRGYDNEQ